MVNAPNAESSAVQRVGANGDVRNRAGIEAYTKFWDKDARKDTQEDSEHRKNVYTDVVNGYYDGE